MSYSRQVLVSGAVRARLGTQDRDGRFVPDGLATLSHPSGARAIEGSYIAGKPGGTWMRWYESGQRLSQHVYRNGILHGPCQQWYENGQLAVSATYHKGQLDGLMRRYSTDGQRIAEIQYRAGKRTIFRRYLRSGEVERYDLRAPQQLLLGGLTPEKVCHVLNSGRVQCVSIAQLASQLAQLVDPQDVEKILHGIDSIYGDYGLDTNNEVLVACSGTWDAIPLGTGTEAKKSLATEEQLSQIASACKNALTAALTPGGVPSSSDSQRQVIDQVLEKVANDLENCRDRGNMFTLPVDDDYDDYDGVIHWDALDADTVPGTSAGERWYLRNFGVPLADGRNWDHMSHSTDELAFWAVIGALAQEAAKVVEIIEEHENRSDEERSRAEAADATLRAAEAARIQEQTGQAPTDEEEREEQCLPSEQCLDPGHPSSPGVGDPGPDGGLDANSCAQKRAWWASIVESCEDSDWQTYSCQQIIRTLNGCVDASEILPGPDGDVTCPYHATKEEQERFQRERDCELRGMISIPSGQGSSNCAPLSTATPTRGIDPCNDPSAMPAPDQCFSVGSPELADGPIARSMGQETKELRPLTKGGANSKTTITPAPVLDGRLSLGDNGLPDLVIFKNSACSPCIRLLAIMEDLVVEFSDRINVHTLDVQQHREVASEYSIEYTPTMIFLNKGRPVGQRKVGAASSDRLRRYLDSKLRVIEETTNVNLKSRADQVESQLA